MATVTELDPHAVASRVHIDVMARANREDDEASIPQAFADLVLEAMAEAGIVDDAELCYFESEDMKVYGYSINEEESRIDLFSVIYGDPPGSNISPDQIRRSFRGMRKFFSSSRESIHLSMEESSPAHDMAEGIFELSENCSSIRLHVLANGPSHVSKLNEVDEDGVEVQENIWDIRRIERLLVAGEDEEEVEVIFGEGLGEPLQAIVHRPDDENYSAFFTVIPGQVLADIYGRYGSRILESNVRSFLSVRGKVNRGIRETITNFPSSFLAYNNGITMTASEVITTPNGSGVESITELRGLQVVNGAQTTASLHNTSRRYGVDLSATQVMAKILELPNVPEDAENSEKDIRVSDVSRYANSQNAITQADFSANHPFHVVIERLSRRVWAPAKAEIGHETHWFYERNRGQYDVERNAGNTRGKIRDFDRINPKSARGGALSQHFKKEELAKFVMAWDQYPHLVVRGAQKNFAEFMIAIAELKNWEPDEQYFQDVVSKAIIFRRTDKLIAREQEKGYKSLVAAHTMSALSHLTSRRLDLNQIWRQQDMPEELQRFVIDLAAKVRTVITSPSGGRGVGEWAKREECWDAVKENALLEFPDNLKAMLGQSNTGVAQGGKRGGTQITLSSGAQTPEAAAEIKQCDDLGSDYFWALAVWGRETKVLDNFQRRICGSVARRMQSGSSPTYKQARIVVKAIGEAERQGFQFSPDE